MAKIKEVSEDEALENFDAEVPQTTDTKHAYLSNEENVEIYDAIRVRIAGLSPFSSWIKEKKAAGFPNLWYYA